jgi:hypothetical protein
MMGRSIDDRVAEEIRKVLRAHPEYGQKRVANVLASNGIEVDPFELRLFLKKRRQPASNRQRWEESPLDPKTWRHPPTYYG